MRFGVKSEGERACGSSRTSSSARASRPRATRATPGSATTSSTAASPSIDKKHFRLNSDLIDETTKIYGERVKSGKYKGTLRWKVDELDAGHHNCDTGKLHWKATPTPPM